MKFQGVLTHWNDERGFGFIKPDGGGQDIFVNIKSFGRVVDRPADGDRLSFEVELGSEGKKRATRVEFLNRPQPSKGIGRAELQRKSVPKTAAGPSSSQASSSRPPWPVLALLSFAIFPVLYVWATVQWGVSLYVLLAYFFLSGWTYFMYVHDKAAARTGQWRVSEGSLLMMSMLGGWPGANLAQHLLRHKSKKFSFRFAHWTMVFLNLIAFGFLASLGMLRTEAWFG